MRASFPAAVYTFLLLFGAVIGSPTPPPPPQLPSPPVVDGGVGAVSLPTTYSAESDENPCGCDLNINFDRSFGQTSVIGDYVFGGLDERGQPFYRQHMRDWVLGRCYDTKRQTVSNDNAKEFTGSRWMIGKENDISKCYSNVRWKFPASSEFDPVLERIETTEYYGTDYNK